VSRSCRPARRCCGLCAADQGDVGGGGGDQRAGGLEDEDGVGVVLAVENERSRHAEGARGRAVDAGRERLAAELGAHRGGRSPGRVVVRGRQGGMFPNLLKDMAARRTSAKWRGPSPQLFMALKRYGQIASFCVRRHRGRRDLTICEHVRPFEGLENGRKACYFL